MLVRRHAFPLAQVYALEIEEYMRDFSAPYFRRANVDQKAGSQMRCMQLPLSLRVLRHRACWSSRSGDALHRPGSAHLSPRVGAIGVVMHAIALALLICPPDWQLLTTSRSTEARSCKRGAGTASSTHSRAQVDVVVGPASESLERLAARGVRFDLAFLDADKGGYLGYYRQVWLCVLRAACLGWQMHQA